jgi:hypothetical protein
MGQPALRVPGNRPPGCRLMAAAPPFWIPSSSMQDTLMINDKVLVSKLVYHFRSIQPDRGIGSRLLQCVTPGG